MMQRLSQGLRKMNKGTVGGQSRVATPSGKRVVPKPVVNVPPVNDPE